MVRDIQKILETIEDNKQKQASSNQQLIDALATLTETTKQLGHNTGETVVALDGKLNVIRDFVVKQAEEITALKIRLLNLEDKLNAKN
jgi:polyhydroxyalkanoate synthesis regulator phasin